MRQRLALIISGTVTAAVLAVGLSAAGFGPSSGFATDDGAGADGTVTAADAAPEPEVVYVKPAPKRKTVVVTRQVAQRDTSAKSGTSAKRAKSGPGARSGKASKSGTKSKSAPPRHREDDDRYEDEKHEDEREREAAKQREEREREAAKQREEREREEHEEDDD
jgi:hypothetical protein